MSRLNVICTGEGIHAWGKSWIEYLLQGLNCDFHYLKPSEATELYDNCLVVTNTTESYFYIRRLQEENRKFGVVLLSDECLTTPMTFLNDPNCVFLARNYFHPGAAAHPKVFHFGLGYKNEFEKYADRRRSVSEREYLWSFMGSLKYGRRHALAMFSELEPNYTYLVEKFNDPNYLTTKKYAQILNDSVFSLAPAGGASNDSFRIYEALECGAIPVVLKNNVSSQIIPSYWHAIFPGSDIPFVNAATWGDAFEEVKSLNGTKRAAEMRYECMDFWRTWKKIWQREFEKRTANLI